LILVQLSITPTLVDHYLNYLEFLETVHQAGTRTARWDVEEFRAMPIV